MLLAMRNKTLKRYQVFLCLQPHSRRIKYSVPTFRGGLSRSLVSTHNKASLAPRNSIPDERSRRKVLKLAASPNFSGARTVEQKKQERVRGEILNFEELNKYAFRELG